MKTLLKNADLFAPEHIGIVDIFIDNGFIAKIDKNLQYSDCEIINCNGKIVCPMFVDGHEHLLGNYWSESGILNSGVGTVVGCLASESSPKQVQDLIDITNRMNAESKIEAFCLAGSKNYTGETSDYILNNSNVVGIKTALFQPQRPKPNLNYEKLKQDSLKTYKAGEKSGKIVQVHIHLDHPFARGKTASKEEINSGKLDNLSWVDKIVEETGLPYSLFKLTHAQKYYDRIVDYANKGCFIDYTAFSGDYDPRFDCLVNAIKNNEVDLNKVSISSDLGITTMEKGSSGEETPISLLDTVKKLVFERDLELKDVLPMVTINPAKILNTQCGIIKEGHFCKLLILDKKLTIDSIFIGKEAYFLKSIKNTQT